MGTVNFVTQMGCSNPANSTIVSSAMKNWRDYASVGGNQPATLFIPSGAYTTGVITTSFYTGGIYSMPLIINPADPTNFPFLGDATVIGDTTGGGVTFTEPSVMGAQQVFDGTMGGSGYVHTVFPGSNNVTLITIGDAGKFHSGQWVILAGLSTYTEFAGTGYPPDWQRMEYHQIQSIAGAVITFVDNIRDTYAETWPRSYSASSTSNDGGPAIIAGLHDWWNCSLTMKNITFLTTGGGNIGSVKSLLLDGVNWTNASTPGSSPSTIKSCICRNCNLAGHGAGWEVDKEIEYLELDNCQIESLNLQSCGTVRKLYVHNGSSVGGLQCGYDTVIDGSSIFSISCGSGGFGQGNSLTATNSNFTQNTATLTGPAVTVPSVLNDESINFMEYMGNGVFRVPNVPSAESFDAVLKQFVPGHRYEFVYRSGSVSLQEVGPNFCALDLYFDASYIYAKTNLPDGNVASFTGKIDNGSGAAGKLLTVTAITGGPIVTGMTLDRGTVANYNIPTGTTIGTFGTGTGGTGTYNLVAAANMLIASQRINAHKFAYSGNAPSRMWAYPFMAVSASSNTGAGGSGNFVTDQNGVTLKAPASCVALPLAPQTACLPLRFHA